MGVKVSKDKKISIWVDRENLIYVRFFYLGFTSCKAEQPLQDMELQEKEAQKDYRKPV